MKEHQITVRALENGRYELVFNQRELANNVTKAIGHGTVDYALEECEKCARPVDMRYIAAMDTYVESSLPASPSKLSINIENSVPNTTGRDESKTYVLSAKPSENSQEMPSEISRAVLSVTEQEVLSQPSEQAQSTGTNPSAEYVKVDKQSQSSEMSTPNVGVLETSLSDEDTQPESD